MVAAFVGLPQLGWEQAISFLETDQEQLKGL